jgi:N,N-dimethylformamidase beta subunit-like, C-terminal
VRRPADAPPARVIAQPVGPSPAGPLGAPLSRRQVLRAAASGSLALAAACGAAALAAAACGASTARPRAERSVSPEDELAILPGPAAGGNRVPRENDLAGTDLWQLPRDGTGGVEGYFDDVSVSPGDQLVLRMRATEASASVYVYRLGWYGGAGGRLVGRWPSVAVASQPVAVRDPSTGWLACRWSPALRLTVPAAWITGTYVAVMRPAGGEPQWATFVVREPQIAGGAPSAAPPGPQRRAPILFVSSVTTEQAYNAWGGRSLYADNSSGAPTVAGTARAVKVSFDRPYLRTRGAGAHLAWELPFVRWQEAHGYDVGYCADLDLGRYPEVVSGRRLVIVAGHPEYWSPSMRATLEQAIAAGTNVAFFSGNEMYWRVRFEDAAGSSPGSPGTDPARGRTLVCYRDPSLDPLAGADPPVATAAWGQPPAAKPEGLVVGLSYGQVCDGLADLVVSAPDHWVFHGTGLRAGDRITKLVGTEFDTWDPDPASRPGNVALLCASPVRARLSGDDATGTTRQATQNSAIYTAPSGATVFAAGTMTWGWGLDDWGDRSYMGETTPVDARAARITANLLDRLG